jgi:hypothetical protein
MAASSVAPRAMMAVTSATTATQPTSRLVGDMGSSVCKHGYADNASAHQRQATSGVDIIIALLRNCMLNRKLAHTEAATIKN